MLERSDALTLANILTSPCMRICYIISLNFTLTRRLGIFILKNITGDCRDNAVKYCRQKRFF